MRSNFMWNTAIRKKQKMKRFFISFLAAAMLFSTLPVSVEAFDGNDNTHLNIAKPVEKETEIRISIMPDDENNYEPGSEVKFLIRLDNTSIHEIEDVTVNLYGDEIGLDNLALYDCNGEIVAARKDGLIQHQNVNIGLNEPAKYILRGEINESERADNYWIAAEAYNREKLSAVAVYDYETMKKANGLFGGLFAAPAPGALEITVTPREQGPYNAGSKITFDVKIKNNTNKDYNAGGLGIVTTVNDSVAVSAPDIVINDIKVARSGGEWTGTVSYKLKEDLNTMNTSVLFDLYSVKNGNPQDDALAGTEYFYDIKKLEGIGITSGRDKGSTFGPQGYLYTEFSFKNYEDSQKEYSYKIYLDGSEVTTGIDWLQQPSGTIGSGRTQSAEFKLPATGSDNSHTVKFVIIDPATDDIYDEKEILINKSNISDFLKDIPGYAYNSTDTDLKILEQLYYGSVSRDSKCPFSTAAELLDILTNSSEAQAKKIWDEYKYDLWDPNFSSRGGCGKYYKEPPQAATDDAEYPTRADNTSNRPDWADEKTILNQSSTKSLDYPKDSIGPFHGDATQEGIVGSGMKLTKDGILASDDSQIKDKSKTATPVGTLNKDNRKYKIDIKGTLDIKQVKPVVLLFQIQTSWQMFDTLHANDRAALIEDGKTEKKINKDLLSLYDIKRGLLEFSQWIEKDGDGALMLGITNFQHDGTHSMLPSPYFTNSASDIYSGLCGWDSFGDCEHIHYKNTELQNAAAALTDNNFKNWVDKDGNKIFQNAEISSVIIGGACESKDLKDNSLLSTVGPTGTLKAVKHQYGIRTNTGYSSDDPEVLSGKAMVKDGISWMDYENEAGKFNGGYYDSVTTREDFVDALKDIYKKASKTLVSEATVTDTVMSEFKVQKDNLKAYVNGEDVTDDVVFKVVVNDDGSTTVSCTYKDLPTDAQLHLEIPVEAQEDYIGGSAVLTNDGNPEIDVPDRVKEEVDDVPKVQVPVRFNVVDGERATVKAGTSIDISELAADDNDASIITKQLEEWLKKYNQLDGVLTYQWVDEAGNDVGSSTSANITQTDRKPPAFPSYEFEGKDEDVGKTFEYKLKVTYTPKASTDPTLTAAPQTEYGKVWVDVIDADEAVVNIKKEIDNYDTSLKDDEFIINVSSDMINTDVVLKHNETSRNIKLKGLESAGIQLDITEVVPMEYKYQKLTIEGEGADSGDLNGNKVTVHAGDCITIIVHNKYDWKPYFHVFNSITNFFKHKQ